MNIENVLNNQTIALQHLLLQGIDKKKFSIQKIIRRKFQVEKKWKLKLSIEGKCW